MMIATAGMPELCFPVLPIDVFACLRRGGRLLGVGAQALRCGNCAVEYAVRLGVPLLVKGCKVLVNPEPIPEDVPTALSRIYGIPEDSNSTRFFQQVLESRYRF